MLVGTADQLRCRRSRSSCEPHRWTLVPPPGGIFPRLGRAVVPRSRGGADAVRPPSFHLRRGLGGTMPGTARPILETRTPASGHRHHRLWGLAGHPHGLGRGGHRVAASISRHRRRRPAGVRAALRCIGEPPWRVCVSTAPHRPGGSALVRNPRQQGLWVEPSGDVFKWSREPLQAAWQRRCPQRSRLRRFRQRTLRDLSLVTG